MRRQSHSGAAFWSWCHYFAGGSLAGFGYPDPLGRYSFGSLLACFASHRLYLGHSGTDLEQLSGFKLLHYLGLGVRVFAAEKFNN